MVVKFSMACRKHTRSSKQRILAVKSVFPPDLMPKTENPAPHLPRHSALPEFSSPHLPYHRVRVIFGTFYLKKRSVFLGVNSPFRSYFRRYSSSPAATIRLRISVTRRSIVLRSIRKILRPPMIPYSQIAAHVFWYFRGSAAMNNRTSTISASSSP